MARIKKFSPKENLSSFQTFIVDDNPNSDYFRITEFKDTFTGGKNGFLIEGSQFLKESTEIKIEILDVAGNTLYFEPGNGIPEYYEGISKLIAVYVYEDTPIGLGKITILGELKQYDDNGVIRDIPANWAGIYNVKWERTFQVNRNLPNEDRVRFYRRPIVGIEEINKPIFTKIPTIVTQTGTLSGIPLVPVENTRLADFSLPTSYRLKIDTGNYWTGSVLNQPITFPALNYAPTITDIVSKDEVIVSPPYTENGLVKSFSNESYSTDFIYLEGSVGLATALTGSFAKIQITDMKTFVGDAARIKVYRRSQSQLTDYEFVQDIQLESNELLRDIETKTATEELYGNFTEPILSEYWITSSNDLVVQFNQDFLYNSVQLDSVGVNNFYTTESFSTQEGVEYNLSFNVRKASNTSSTDYVKAYLSGSFNNKGITQTISTVSSTNTVLQKTNISENIVANNSLDTRLYFEVVGNDWYISDVSFKAAQETSFSPDEITFIQSVPKTLQSETFDYRFEFYDINNNYIPVLVEATKTFDGGNLNLFEKNITITPSANYFSFDSASAPANPLPPFSITFDIETTLITGSISFTSGAYDIYGDFISASEYNGGQYPGLLEGIETDSPVLTVANFTGSRDDIVVQYIRFTAHAEDVSDDVVISRVADGKGGVNFEIRPYRGTIIKNKSDKDLEVQAIRIDGVNEIILRDGLPQVGFSDAKLRVLSSSIDELTTNESASYYLLSEAVSVGFLKGVTAGLTGSGEIDYNATFNRDSIDGELTVYLMDGPTQDDILTSIILTDLQDGLASGYITFDTEQFGIKPRTEREFTPSIGRITGSFYLRGTNENPISGTLDIYPSMSVDPLTIEPTYYMFYVTNSFDRRISVEVTDFNNNVIGSGRPGVEVPFYSAVSTKQLTTKFTYLEDITSASISVDKTFFAVPDGNPGDDAIVVNINPNPITLNADQRGRVFNYDGANTTLTVTQGRLPLIFTGSKIPGTFTTASITPIGIEYSTLDLYGDATMSLSGFGKMTDLTASVEYRLEIHPYFTGSFFTQSYFQQIQKSLDGAAAINVELEPLVVSLNAEENGGVVDFTAANTTLRVKQGDEYLEFSTSSQVLPGTFSASFEATNVSIGFLSSSNDRTTDRDLDDTLYFQNFNTFTEDSASVDYSIVVYPFSITNGIVSGSQTFTRKQLLTKQKEGTKARSVSLQTTSEIVNFDGDGVVTSPEGSIFLTATEFNITSSQAYFQFYRDGFAYSTITTNNEFEIGSGDATNPGETVTWTVELRDGTSTSPVVATAEVTISGIQSGANNYQVFLTNDNTSVLVETDGTVTLTGTGTQIKAFKGTQELTHVTNYSSPTLDLVGDPIGSLGEFSASLFTKPGYITQTNIPIGNPAAVGDIGGWTNPQDNKSATIVYKVDIENGRATYFLSQSLSTVFEGATGPGIVFRGPYTGSVEYLFDLNQKRRDAVLYDKDGDGVPEMYYATLQIVPSSSIGGESTSITPFGDIGGTSADYWEELGEQEFFVAAKIAIFEESFVENSINVGIPDPGNVNSKIAIVGGTQEPYIAIGQEVQGYNQEGVFVGVSWDDISSGSKYGKLSLKNTAGDRYLRWDGETLEIAGTIQVTGGNAATSDSVSGSFPTNSQTGSLVNPSSYSFGPFGEDGFDLASITPGTTPGLYLGATHLGYHDGTIWNAYLDDDGNFYLGGNDGGALMFNQSTGDLNVTGIVSASAGEFGGWVIDKTGISYKAPFVFGFTNNNASTLRYHGNLSASIALAYDNAPETTFKSLPYVDGTPADMFFREADPFDNYFNTITVYGTTTTTHKILASGSGDYGLDYGIDISPSLYAESSSLQAIFVPTGSIALYTGDTPSGSLVWKESTSLIESDTILSDWIPISGDTISSYIQLGAPDGLTFYLLVENVTLPSAPFTDTIAFQILEYNENNPSSGYFTLQLSDLGTNTYGQDINLISSGRVTLYFTALRYQDDAMTVLEGSVSAGTRTLAQSPSDAEAVRLHTSGSNYNDIENIRPYFSMGQLTQSYDETGVFIGFESGSNVPAFSIRSIEGQYLRWNGSAVELSGDVVGSTIVGSTIVGGAINVPAIGTGSRFSVDVLGNVSASNANIQGIINADSGRIGQWIIDGDTGNLQDDNAEVVFDPLIPELQFYTGSGEGRVKKVTISPQDTLTSPDAATATLNITGSSTIATSGTVSSVTSAATNTFTVLGTVYNTGKTATGGDTSNGYFVIPQAGDITVTLNSPAFSVTTPAGTVAHTTSYPSYPPPYNYYYHGGFSTPRYSNAYLWLDAIEIGTGNTLGSTLLGQAYAQSAYTQDNYYIGYSDDGGPGFFISVTGDTLITLNTGEKIPAKDVIEGQKISAWNWINELKENKENKFEEGVISKIKTRTVDKIYRVIVGDKSVDVSDSHGFWLDGNKQIRATELIPGESKIYVKDGDKIISQIVDKVEILEYNDLVYSFTVPDVNNYLSNDILSHNAASTYWEYYPAQTISAQNYAVSAQSNRDVSMTISSAGTVQFRYRLRFGASSGQTVNVNSSGGSSISYLTHTVSSFLSAPSLDTSLEVSTPTNFVEIKAGGIQVVSDSNVYVSLPRKPRGSSNPTLMQIEGGTIFTNAILPSTDVSPSGTFNIGGAFSRFNDVYADEFNNGVSSIGSNGYSKLANGVIIQWGYATGTAVPTTVNFPYTFPNACYSVSVTTDRNGSGASGYNHAYDVTTTGFKAVFDAAYDGWWIAIGK